MTDITPIEKLNKVILIELSLLKNINLHHQKRYNTAQKIWVICSRFAGPISFSSREGGGMLRRQTSHMSQPQQTSQQNLNKCHNQIPTNVTTSKNYK